MVGGLAGWAVVVAVVTVAVEEPAATAAEEAEGAEAAMEGCNSLVQRSGTR